MKLFSKNIDSNGKGTVTLQIEDEEDIWQAYNLINRGDSVKSSTYRKGKRLWFVLGEVRRSINNTSALSLFLCSDHRKLDWYNRFE